MAQSASLLERGTDDIWSVSVSHAYRRNTDIARPDRAQHVGMPVPFKFIAAADYERLTHSEQLTYLSDAMEEMDRLKVPPDQREWLKLFSQPKADE